MVDLQYPDERLNLFVNCGQLEPALINLMINARDVTPDAALFV
jgi:hypothetical protein